MDMEERNTPERKKDRGRRSRLRFWLSIAAGSFLAITVLGLILLPFAIEWGGERYLKDAGARRADITNVDINPFTGRLAVLGLDVEGPNGDRLSLDRFEADADVLLLFKKRVRINNVSMVGLEADIRQSEAGVITVGGLQAPASTAQTAAPDEKGTATWGFGFGIVEFYDLQFHVTAPGFEETAAIDHLLFKDFATWLPENKTALLINISAFGAGLKIDGTAVPLGARPAIDLRYNISGLTLEHFSAYLKETAITELAGTLGVDGRIRGTFPQGSRSMELRTAVSSDQLSVTLSGEPDSITWKHDKVTLEMSGSYADTGTVQPDNIMADLNLSASGIRVLGGGGKADLLSIDSLELEKLKTTGTREVTAERFTLKGMALLSRPGEKVREKDPREVVRLAGLDITGIGLENGQLLHVNDVAFDSLKVWIVLLEGGVLEPVQLLPVFAEAAPEEVTEKAADEMEAPQPAMDIIVGRFTISGDSSFTFRDLDIKPPISFNVDSLKMNLSDLNTNPSTGHAEITLDAGMGKYSSFNIEGTVDAPWARPDVDLQVKLRTLDLPHLTPYTDRHVGYILKSGHLDTDLDVKISDGKLNIQTEVVVNRIEMDPVKEEDEQKANERLGIPVRTALSLLKDKNDDIKLSLPIEGDLNDPEFKISDVVMTVTGNALKKGVSAFYGPLGATILTGGLLPPGTFSVLGKVFEGATAVSFDPVIFEPLASELSAEHKPFLDQLAGKLSEKPETRLIMCGKVTRRDIQAMREKDFEILQAAAPPAVSGTTPSEPVSYHAVMDAPGENQTAGTALQVPQTGPPSIEEAPLTDEEKERLIELAKQRALAVKDYLTEAGGLEPGRLFVCYSEVEKEAEGLPPRVDLSI